MGEKTRERRVFTAEFKVEAVRRMAERRAAGVSLAQISRELDVRDDLLRKWQRQAAERAGAPAADVFPGQGRLPAADAELKRLEREVARLKQENAWWTQRVNATGPRIGPRACQSPGSFEVAR